MTRAWHWFIIAAACMYSGLALAQSTPGFQNGQVITGAQLNAAFANKQDFLGSATTLPLSNGFVFFGVGGVATGTAPSTVLDSFSSARGSLLTRGSSLWGALAPGTAGLPLVSGGAAGDLSYAALGVPAGGTGGTTWTLNGPLLGNGTDGLIQGTLSGSTTVLATASGTLTNGHCVSIDSGGNFVDAGGACTTGGGGGTVSSGTAGQLAFYATTGTTVSGATAGGDCTFSAGTFTCTKTNGVAFAASATTDTTNGSNISTGTVAAARVGQINLSASGNGGVTGNLQISSFAGGSGAASSSFWRGDGAWTAVADNTALWAATANRPVDAAGLSGAGTITTLTDAATIAVDMNTGVNFTVTLGGNRTLGNPTNTQVGRTGCIYVVQPSSGGPFTLTPGSNWKTPSGAGFVLSTAANAVDVICYAVRSSTFIWTPGANKSLQ